MSYRISASNFGYNLARGRNAYQNSKLYHGAQPTADKAVDGERDPKFSHGSCTHTRISVTKPFWVVDLGHVYRIAFIAITNRLGKTHEQKCFDKIVVKHSPYFFAALLMYTSFRLQNLQCRSYSRLYPSNQSSED